MPADVDTCGPQPKEAEDDGYVSQEQEIRKGKAYVNGAFKDIFKFISLVDSVDVEYYTLIFSYVDWKDRKPLQENPPELTPEEKARALDAASNMQIEAKDQEADILKATSDMIW